ncbi:MAG: response regulator, partial [Deltaproteobacteria bacterium]|nr:response regulator [Deltaproteobacteria bacterium]
MKTGSLNVLVADKTQSVLDNARRSLESSGFAVTTTLSGGDAVEMARDADFDVALVDYHTPGLPGLGVLAELRQLQPGCIRVLMVTSLNPDMAVSAINSGDVSRVIVKPFHATGLRQAVTDATLQQQRMGEHLATLRSSERKWQREALNECFAKDLLQIAIQPIVSAQDRKVWAYEGLLR